MATSELELWLKNLKDTIHFPSVAKKVFERVIHGQGPGLMILQGPSKIANKSYFLNTVKAFQKGVPPEAKKYFSFDLWRLLAKVDINHYQCVSILVDRGVDRESDYPIQTPDVSKVPLYIALPLSMASASQKRGLKKGQNIVVLCDNLHEFIRHNQQANMTFLKQLAELLYSLKEITFLGAYTLTCGKGLEGTPLSTYVLPLGYD